MNKKQSPKEQDRLMDFMDALADFTLPKPEDELASIRRLRLFGIWYFVGFLIFFGILGILANFWAPIAGLVFVAMVAAVVYIYTGGNRFAKKYGDAIKQKLLRESFSKEFTKLRLRPEMGLPMEYAQKRALLRFTERHYRSDDFLSAVYHDVAFRRADVYAAMTSTDADGLKHTNLFEGRWMVLYLPEEAPAGLIIQQRIFDSSYQPSQDAADRFEPYETKDEAFDQEFIVFTTDKTQVERMLKPRRRQAILEYCKKADGNLMVAFLGREMHVLIDNDQNAMEPDPYSAECEELLQGAIDREIEVIKSTIDTLLQYY